MILVDSSVWIDHFRNPMDAIREVIEIGALTHPFLIGEVALGSIKNRKEILAGLGDLVTVLPLPHSQIMRMIEVDQLYGTGLQYIDVHLLASARITSGCTLWSRDKRLRAAARRFGVAANFD